MNWSGSAGKEGFEPSWLPGEKEREVLSTQKKSEAFQEKAAGSQSAIDLDSLHAAIQRLEVVVSSIHNALLIQKSQSLSTRLRRMASCTAFRFSNPRLYLYMRRPGRFDHEWYLKRYPDIGAAGVSPLQHYLRHGWREGRNPNTVFDTRWYLATYPDVAAAGIDPLRHYLEYGWREGRDPGPDFSTSGYLAAHPEVAAAGLNPLEHHLGRRPPRAVMRLLAWKRRLRLWRRRQHEDAYRRWMAEVETPSIGSRAEIRARIAALARTPRISVIVPVYNTPERYLRACIRSVLRQSYPNWELCLADDASTAPHVRAVLAQYAAQDDRIRVAYRRKNGHIAAASNSALALATGDYVALLDHDDELAEHALFFVAEALVNHPQAMIVYSDEDKIDAKGRRYDPHFKSDWNPDLLFSQNYVSHLGVYSRALINAIGGFRAGVEGSQDHDLLLRCLPHVRDDQIVHVPRVLYHWRAVSGSTARSASAKDYATEAALKALRDHFAATGQRVTVEAGALPHTYRVRYPVPEPTPLVSILIPTRDRVDLLRTCVGSILARTDYANYEILILDNGSTEPETLAYLDGIRAKDPLVQVLSYDRPFNFSAINNFGVRHARGDIVALVNNDIEVITPEWLTEMVSHACRPEIGCVGAKLYYSDGRIQHAGVILGIGGVAGHSHKYHPGDASGYFSRLKLIQNVSAVTAACLVVRRELYMRVGGLDEDNLPIAFNDVDFCLKVRESGYRNLWTPYAELYHHESASRGAEDTPEKQERFQREIAFMRAKWGEELDNDPLYSPNLTRDREDFSLADANAKVSP